MTFRHFPFLKIVCKASQQIQRTSIKYEERWERWAKVGRKGGEGGSLVISSSFLMDLPLGERRPHLGQVHVHHITQCLRRKARDAHRRNVPIQLHPFVRGCVPSGGQGAGDVELASGGLRWKS